MDYIGYIKMLFLVVGSLGVLLFFLEIHEYVFAMYYRKYMYRNLNNIWSLAKEFDGDIESDVIYKIKYLLYEECENLYGKYVISNKYLNNAFASPKDLLIKFLTANKGTFINSNLKFELLSDEHKYDIQSYEGEKPKSKIKLFEKVSVAVTVIGIVVTVISFFI